MFSPQKRLSKDIKDFGFPFQPYGIQQQFMESLYAVLEEKKIGIFESPTGTGKTLTLLCGALRWLSDHEELVRSEIKQEIQATQVEIQKLNDAAEHSNDWIQFQFEVTQKREELKKLQNFCELIKIHDEKMSNIKKRSVMQGKDVKINQRHLKSLQDSIKRTEASLFLDDTKVELEDDVETQEKDAEVEVEDEDGNRSPHVQIFFCSRTHSQLSQVVRELKRTIYGPNIRCTTIASRQQLCVHPKVRKLPNAFLMNEACLDLTQNSAKSSANCPFKMTKLVEQLSETVLANVLDIEELVTAGETSRSCSYFASRLSAKNAQIVMLPYQVLLHRNTRQQSGIDLRGSIVIIDEAHNLLDTISQMHSCELSLQHLLDVKEQIISYKMCYAKRFNANNLLCINQLLFVVKRLIKMLQPPSTTKPIPKSAAAPTAEKSDIPFSRILRTYELTTDGEFFNIDLFQLINFAQRHRFAQKLHHYCKRKSQQKEKETNQNSNQQQSTAGARELLERLVDSKRKKQELVTTKAENSSKTSDQFTNIATSSSPIRLLLSFIEFLTENADDGRVLMHVDPSKDNTSLSSFKYILLNPGNYFQDILKDARAVIVAGGTMQPVTDFTEQLFYAHMERVETHCFDHVVQQSSVLSFAVSEGPQRQEFHFNYAQRSNVKQLGELGLLLQELSDVVPAGLICFVPSYSYLDEVYKFLKNSGMLAAIAAKKQIFCESRSGTQSIEKLLSDYADVIRRSKNGALLFGVVGGKLSEGLNFADDLGRGVIIVGQPYPNRESPELRERMKYLDATLHPGAGDEYYENLCMKTVNQCIGRSVRHIHDYACVFLVDKRYTKIGIQQKLPQWISRNLKNCNFDQLRNATRNFFKNKSSSIA